MSRELYQRHEELVTEPLPITDGGTSASTAPGALTSLGGLSNTKIGQPNGIAPLDTNAQIPVQFLPPADVNSVSVSGPKQLNVSGVGEYQITDFDFYQLYTLSCSTGTVSRVHDVITYTAPANGGNHGFTLNGVNYVVVVIAPYIEKPFIIYPIDLATNIRPNPDFAASDFTPVNVTGRHDGVSVWEIATLPDFSNKVTLGPSTSDIAHYHAIPSFDIGLTLNTTYYVRMKYTSAGLPDSLWSDPISFTTRATDWSPNETAIINRLWQPLVADANRYGEFGQSVALNAAGDLMAVGTPYEELDYTTDVGGAVYIFQFNILTHIWDTIHKIQIPNAAELSNSHVDFGKCVALSGDGNTLVISSPRAKNSDAKKAGAFYVFKTGIDGDFTTYSLRVIIRAPVYIQEGYFGDHVALSRDGTKILITQTAHTGYANDLAYVYYYTFDGLDAVLEQTIDNGTSGLSNYLSMNEAGTRFICSNMYAAPDGEVYVYDRTGNTWSLTATIIPADTGLNSFGWPCIISNDGNTIVSANGYGEFFFFKYDTGNWVKYQKISEPEWNDGIYGGSPWCFAMNRAGTLLVVGVPQQTNAISMGPFGSWDNAGSAYLYEKVGETWQRVRIINASDTHMTDYFGCAAAMNDLGTVIAVGAGYKYWDADRPHAGAVYVES